MNGMARTTSRALRLAAMLAATLAASALPLPSQAQRSVDLHVRVVASQPAGRLPGVFRPSVMMSWADAEAASAFLALGSDLGTIRVTLEPLLTDSTSLADFRARLVREAGNLKLLSDRGATIVITFARMPRWLSRSQDDSLAGPFGFSVREASPPKDVDLLMQLATEMARVINVELGLDPLYEFWNEPESRGFWRGTQAELFQAYTAFAAGVRRADPKAKVGGPAPGSWADRRAGEPKTAPTLVQAFINHVAGPVPGKGTLPLDFISWHNFGTRPYDGWQGATEVRRWLRAGGLSTQVPQYVTEWNRWATFPEWLDPGRDEAPGAAYLVAALHEMALQGIAGHTLAALQDFRVPEAGSAYPGDFGLLTRAPVMKKASFHAMQMLTLLDRERVAVDLDGARADASGVDVIATRGQRRVSVLLSRHPVGEQIFTRSMNRSGFLSVDELGVPPERLAAFGKRQSELGPGDGTPAARRALERARAAAEIVRDRPIDELVVRLRIDGVPGGARYSVYRIDAANMDPARRYRDARRGGQSHAAAVQAAAPSQVFRPAIEGSGALPPIAMPAHSVVLVVVDAAGGAQ